METNVFFFVKFGEKQNIESLLLNGDIYMNTIKWFKEYEKRDIGDKYEGTVEIRNIKKAKLTLGLSRGPIELMSKDIQLRQHVKGHIGNLYSLYAISDDLVRRKRKLIIDKRMQAFGTHCLLIKDVIQFTERIKGKLTELGYEYDTGLVRYKNYSINNHELS